MPVKVKNNVFFNRKYTHACFAGGVNDLDKPIELEIDSETLKKVLEYWFVLLKVVGINYFKGYSVFIFIAFNITTTRSCRKQRKTHRKSALKKLHRKKIPKKVLENSYFLFLQMGSGILQSRSANATQLNSCCQLLGYKATSRSLLQDYCRNDQGQDNRSNASNICKYFFKKYF